MTNNNISPLTEYYIHNKLYKDYSYEELGTITRFLCGLLYPHPFPEFKVNKKLLEKIMHDHHLMSNKLEAEHQKKIQAELEEQDFKKYLEKNYPQLLKDHLGIPYNKVDSIRHFNGVIYNYNFIDKIWERVK